MDVIIINAVGDDVTDFYVVPESNYHFIANMILYKFNVDVDTLFNIYKSKYIKSYTDKIILLNLLEDDSQLLRPLIKIITKKMMKMTEYLSIKFKKNVLIAFKKCPIKENVGD